MVVMAATDQPIVYGQGLVTADVLKRLGLTVDLQAMDWGTLITRRASREPLDKGGWNIFFTWTIAPDLLDPSLASALRGNGEKAWFGWPTDAKLESLRQDWIAAPDLAGQQRIAAAVQDEAFHVVTHIVTGQFVTPTPHPHTTTPAPPSPLIFLPTPQ